MPATTFHTDTGCSDTRANHSLGHQLPWRSYFFFRGSSTPVQWEIWHVVMMPAWIWHSVCVCMCDVCLWEERRRESWSGTENHRDLPCRQQFNEACSRLNKSAHSPSRGVHSFLSLFFWRVLHEYFIPSALLPAQQPVTLWASSKNAATLPIWCGAWVGGVAEEAEDVWGTFLRSTFGDPPLETETDASHQADRETTRVSTVELWVHNALPRTHKFKS